MSERSFIDCFTARLEFFFFFFSLLLYIIRFTLLAEIRNRGVQTILQKEEKTNLRKNNKKKYHFFFKSSEGFTFSILAVIDT